MRSWLLILATVWISPMQLSAYIGGSEFRTLGWIDETGKQEGQLKSPGDIGDMQLSPDGMRLVYTLWGSASTNRDIWIYDIPRQLPTKFTFDGGIERYPIWSPNGKSIIYASIKRALLISIANPVT